MNNILERHKKVEQDLITYLTLKDVMIPTSRLTKEEKELMFISSTMLAYYSEIRN